MKDSSKNAYYANKNHIQHKRNSVKFNKKVNNDLYSNIILLIVEMQVIPNQYLFQDNRSSFPSSILPLKKKHLAMKFPMLSSFSASNLNDENFQKIDKSNYLVNLNSILNVHFKNNLSKKQESSVNSSIINQDENDQAPSKETEENNLRERNRIAAKKWRMKRDKYLEELEQENDELRKQAFVLYKQMQELRIESEFFNEEIQFFQSFMASIIHITPNL